MFFLLLLFCLFLFSFFVLVSNSPYLPIFKNDGVSLLTDLLSSSSYPFSLECKFECLWCLTNLASINDKSDGECGKDSNNSNDNQIFSLSSNVRNLIYSGIIPYLIDIISKPLFYLSNSSTTTHSSFSNISSRFSFSTVSLLIFEQALWCLLNIAGESKDVIYYLLNFKENEENLPFNSNIIFDEGINKKTHKSSYFITLLMNIFEIFTNQAIFLVSKILIEKIGEHSSYVSDISGIKVFIFIFFNYIFYFFFWF
jgi:hypothetical protein